jgi:hypothetical protein
LLLSNKIAATNPYTQRHRFDAVFYPNMTDSASTSTPATPAATGLDSLAIN